MRSKEAAKKTESLIKASVAPASEEQARGIHQINEVVGSIDGLTRRNAANSEESASGAKELSSQSEELATLVATFTLERGAASIPARPPPPSRAMESRRRRPSVPRASRRPGPMAPPPKDADHERFPGWDA